MSLRRTISCLLLAGLAGCGTTTCDRYVDAVHACYTDAGLQPPLGVDAETLCPDEAENVSDDYWACLADAWSEGTCETSASRDDIGDAARTCSP